MQNKYLTKIAEDLSLREEHDRLARTSGVLAGVSVAGLAIPGFALLNGGSLEKLRGDMDALPGRRSAILENVRERAGEHKKVVDTVRGNVKKGVSPYVLNKKVPTQETWLGDIFNRPSQVPYDKDSIEGVANRNFAAEEIRKGRQNIADVRKAGDTAIKKINKNFRNKAALTAGKVLAGPALLGTFTGLSTNVQARKDFLESQAGRDE